MQLFLNVTSTIALLFIACTMLLRANDLKWKKERIWRARAVGLVITGVTPFGMIQAMWINSPALAVYLCAFLVGNAIVFLTTPNLPPWYRYWFKGDQVTYERRDRSDRRVSIDRHRDENP